MLKPITLLLVTAFLIPVVSCSLLQRVDERVETFLLRLSEIIGGWEEAGLLPPPLAERARESIDRALQNWRREKENLLRILVEIRAWLFDTHIAPADWDAVVEQAFLDGVLSRRETDELRSESIN